MTDDASTRRVEFDEHLRRSLAHMGLSRQEIDDFECYVREHAGSTTMADLDAIRAAHLDGRPDSTHWGDCHLAHPHCAIAVLLAEVERLRDGIRQIAAARCLGNLPPGCAGTCVTCQARKLLDEDDR